MAKMRTQLVQLLAARPVAGSIASVIALVMQCPVCARTVSSGSHVRIKSQNQLESDLQK